MFFFISKHLGILVEDVITFGCLLDSKICLTTGGNNWNRDSTIMATLEASTTHYYPVVHYHHSDRHGFFLFCSFAHKEQRSNFTSRQKRCDRHGFTHNILMLYSKYHA
jgi:hypothetical protein